MSNIYRQGPGEPNFFRPSYESHVNAVVKESTPLSNKIIEIVGSYFSCFNLNIETNHPPKLYTQDSDEIFNGCSFFDLARDHFKMNAFLYLAVIDSKDKHSCVVELSALRLWYREKRWSALEFKNPLTRNICECIRILAVNQFGNISTVSNNELIDDFRIISANILNNTIVMNAITAQEEQDLNVFYDHEVVNCLLQALDDPAISISINWKSIASFLKPEFGSRGMYIVNRLELRQSALASKNADYHQCLGDFYLNYTEGWFQNPFLHKAEICYVNVLLLEKKSLVALERNHTIMSYRIGKGLIGLISELHESIRHEPTPLRYCMLGEALLHTCEDHEALNAFQKAIELDSEFHVAKLKIASINECLFLESQHVYS